MGKESSFQSKIIKLINLKYGTCIKYNVDYKAKAGMPDTFAAINNKAVFMEIKTDEGEASTIQKAQMRKIKKNSTKYVYIISPRDYSWFVTELDKIKRGEI